MAEPMDIDIATPDDSMSNYDQNMSQPRCPYRMSANSSSSNNSFRPSHSQAFHHPPLPHPSNHFLSNHLPNPTWNYSPSHQPLQPTFNSTLNSRFLPPFDSSNQAGRARELAYFDHYHTHGDGRQQSHPSFQTQQTPFQESRSLFQPQIPTQPSTMSTQNAGTSGEGPAPSNRFSVPSSVASSNYTSIFARPDRANGSSQGSPNSTTASHGSDGQPAWNVPPHRQLPPPILQPYRVLHSLPSLRDSTRGTSNPNQIGGSSGHVIPPQQNSRASLPPPRLSRETSMANPIHGSQQEPRDWQQETAYVDFDSDDSLEEGSPGQPSSRHGAGFNNRAFQFHDEEGILERARAARRAQAASVKFVASASALASFEKVDSNTLGEDERSCIICYNDFGVMNPDGHIECAVRLPKCKHVFGDHCIKQWLKDSDSCPYCRDKLPSEPKQEQISVSSQREHLRRLLADGRNGRMLSQLPPSPWGEIPGEERSAYEVAMTSAAQQARQNEYQSLVQDQLNRQGHEMLAILRREVGVDADYPHARGIPDHEGGRSRRTRGRHSLGRMSAQTSIRPSGSNATRVRLNHQQPPMRTPIQPSLSFDGGSTAQQRSITPHPAGLSNWSQGPLSNQPTSSGRPSSLPNERSPLGQATENAQINIPGPTSTNNSGAASRPTSNGDSWTSTNGGAQRFTGWMAPITANGRPASAEFLHEMPGSRQLALEGMLGLGLDYSTNRNQVNSQLPQLQPSHQDNEFHQQFPQLSYRHPRYPGGQ